MTGRAPPALAATALAAASLSFARPPEPSAPPAARALPLPAAHATPVVDYTLRARLDAERHIVAAEGTILWRNAAREPAHELWLHLYLNAFRGEQTRFFRERGPGFRGSLPLTDPGGITLTRLWARELSADLLATAATTSPDDPHDATDLRVPLPAPVPPGGALTLDVAFESDLPSIVLRTGYAGSFHMVAQWFPKVARREPDGTWAHVPVLPLSEFYADVGTFDVTLDVPESFVVGATGRRVEERVEQGRRVVRHVQGDVHDFAFTAWDRFEVLEEQAEGVALRSLYPPGYELAARDALRAATFGLRHLGAAYGRYPYATLTLVHPPRGAEEAGGMEYPTLITTGGPTFGDRLGARLVAAVTLHELAHQWFQGMLASNEHAWPFLDEGLASFADMDAARELFPEGSLLRAGWLRIDMDAAHRMLALGPAAMGPIARAAGEFATGREYGARVYSRTAVGLETLARVFGRDALRGALGRYARRHRFGHPTPDDLLAAVREEVGAVAADNLRRLLFDGAGIDLSIADLASRPREDGVPGHAGWVVVRRRGALSFPVEVELHAADGVVRRVAWDGSGESARIPYEGGGALTRAIVDPERRVLLDEDLSNNARVLGPPAPALRVLERAMYLIALAAGLGAP